jgi:uncharacterized NAD-dependent epimerase/dehydratase family protein
MPTTAVVITNGHLGNSNGKTAHGLIRGSERYTVRAVLDPVYAGQDAGMVLDQVHRDIPIFGTVTDLLQASAPAPETAIIGVALDGGILPANWKPMLCEILENGLSLVSGLHSQLSADPMLSAVAARAGVQIIDIRKPKPLEALNFFSGAVFDLHIPRIAVLGTDCAIGKRTTGRLVMQMCRRHNIATEMIYTGQTGWLQGYPYGFVLDATPNDFVSGELERAIVQCAAEAHPDLMLLEGQSALRNPFGPCGAELILSGDARHVILQHAPFRTYFEDMPHPKCRLPAVEQEIDLIRRYGARTIAVCLNGENGNVDELKRYQHALAETLELPVLRPLEEGVDALLPVIRQIIADTVDDK